MVTHYTRDPRRALTLSILALLVIAFGIVSVAAPWRKTDSYNFYLNRIRALAPQNYSLPNPPVPYPVPILPVNYGPCHNTDMGTAAIVMICIAMGLSFLCAVCEFHPRHPINLPLVLCVGAMIFCGIGTLLGFLTMFNSFCPDIPAGSSAGPFATVLMLGFLAFSTFFAFEESMEEAP